jgi:hypothetical protein
MPDVFLNDIIEQSQPCVLKEARIDASKWYGEGVEFVYHEPSVAAQFTAHADAAIIRASHPDYPENMCSMMALMALCHVSPPVKVDADGRSRPVGKLYCDLVAKNGDVFMYLMKKFGDAFPQPGAKDTEKNA